MARESQPTFLSGLGNALTQSEISNPNAASPVTIALLGASNLSRGYWALRHCLCANLRPRRVNVIAALGPGRGYVARGGLWPMIFQPINECSVFDTIKKQHKEGDSTFAFLTDLGNDFLFNVTGEELINVLDITFNRLEESGTRILVTPIHPILMEVLTPAIYKILRTWLYPKSRVSFEQVVAGIGAVNDFLVEAEEAGRIKRVLGLDDFLGWDYVHYGWMQANRAWTLAVESICSSIGETCNVTMTREQMFTSYFENGVRLAGTEMLRWYPRRTDLF
ncbi:MAG: hypothetical protein G3M70_09515 [Candidatus Nitronauta litoralis]|uniref:SGNH hydrolase-type esterase domain-containing protein n=1 Tax=Candidatus Nitronauta litoralis TaxID=2705533 RepID=A0A7T0BWD3_9BACT|nr:MAG: hypothetical protein G3M70_09515 [Candidatus Nitronauta litoralis]